MARDRAGTREAYAAKTRAEIASLAEQGVLFAGNAFSSVTLVKGEPEEDGAAPFSGPDGRALRDALMALGYAPEEIPSITPEPDAELVSMVSKLVGGVPVRPVGVVISFLSERVAHIAKITYPLPE